MPFIRRDQTRNLLSTASADSRSDKCVQYGSLTIDNRIKTEGVEYLTEMIQNNNFPRLEELSLISNNIKDEGLMKLISVMKYGFLPHLRTIYLSDNKLHDESVKQLSTVLADRKIAGNAELYLGCNSLSSAMIQNLVSLLYIAPPLKGEPPLKYVVLEKSNKYIVCDK